MSKEEILKGFRVEFSEYLRPKTIGVFDSILLANEFEEYLEKTIDKTREETIREVEAEMKNIYNDEEGRGNWEYTIEYKERNNEVLAILNKLKK